jgi:hypothetical protein
MKHATIAVVFFLMGVSNIYSQQVATVPGSQAVNQLDAITIELSKISRSVDRLQNNWKSFFEQFTTNQGVRLTERQQKLLLAFEVMNRAEQRLGNLQKMRLESTEKQSTMRLQLARVTDDLLPESIDRYVSTRGSLNAEQLRDIRRQALLKERTEISNLLFQIQRDLDTNNEEIRQTEQLLRNIRGRIFPELEKELADL